MKKFILTFGEDHLKEFNVRPSEVALTVKAKSGEEAAVIADEVLGIGNKYFGTYRVSNLGRFKIDYNMVEYTLDELESTRF